MTVETGDRRVFHCILEKSFSKNELTLPWSAFFFFLNIKYNDENVYQIYTNAIQGPFFTHLKMEG